MVNFSFNDESCWTVLPVAEDSCGGLRFKLRRAVADKAQLLRERGIEGFDLALRLAGGLLEALGAGFDILRRAARVTSL